MPTDPAPTLDRHCRSCGDLVYLDPDTGLLRCDGCDHAPTFCDCSQRREIARRNRARLVALRSRATAPLLIEGTPDAD